MIEKERITALNSKRETNGDFIFYWMQQAQRTRYNHALEFAIQKANKKNKPVIVYFGLTNRFPDANMRHYQFMMQGLKQVSKNLQKRNIMFILRNEQPFEGIVSLSKEASLVVVDRGYLHVQKEWRKKVSHQLDCPLIQVESDVVVPVETTSHKEEYAAYTIRPKIHKHLSRFLVELKQTKVQHSSLDYNFSSLDSLNINKLISKIHVDDSVSGVSSFSGGEDQAEEKLNEFLNTNIKMYDEKRNDPSKKVTSQLSPYLHFGQISPLFIALKVNNEKLEVANNFLEELIVRRELSMNFIHFNNSYDRISCLPQWAFDSLKKHENDKREYIYSLKDLEQASTHDPFWNAAQKEMILTGKMHGYMRMYWGKKILEWTDSISKAFEYALHLNNRYELDGRDPNGYAGVAWCFGKHDRAWKERPIFGKVRYMSKNGLKRKGNIDLYVSSVNKKYKDKK